MLLQKLEASGYYCQYKSKKLELAFKTPSIFFISSVRKINLELDHGPKLDFSEKEKKSREKVQLMKRLDHFIKIFIFHDIFRQI